MSLPPQRILAKRSSKAPEIVDDVQDWENHIIIRVPEDCVEKMNQIVLDDPKSEELGITIMNDMRHAQIRLGNRLLSAKLLDLPCINEVYKTFDKKHIYKVADLSQILVCSHDAFNPTTSVTPATTQSTPEASSSITVIDDSANEAKTAKREARQWQYPHGLTPPMKSARRRRFRKTKKKKYMDAPEVEKELKRLLRADLEADSVKWEVVEDKKKETTISSGVAPQVSETTLFGETVSSSDEEPDLVDVAEEKDD